MKGLDQGLLYMANCREGKKKGEDLTVAIGTSPIDNGLFKVPAWGVEQPWPITDIAIAPLGN